MQVASLDPRGIRHRPLRLAFQLLDRLVQSADQRFLAEVVDLTKIVGQHDDRAGVVARGDRAGWCGCALFVFSFGERRIQRAARIWGWELSGGELMLAVGSCRWAVVGGQLSVGSGRWLVVSGRGLPGGYGLVAARGMGIRTPVFGLQPRIYAI